MEKAKFFRKRKVLEEDEDDGDGGGVDLRSELEEVRLLQKQRERLKGIGTDALALGAASLNNEDHKAAAAAEESRQLVLEETFAQETAVEKEDPNMLKYVEQEMAKRKGLEIEKDAADGSSKGNDNELYAIPDHLKVRKKGADENGQAWATGIAEIQLPIDYKLKNIEETEMAKKHLQERRPYMGRSNRGQEAIMPASFSADYFQRGRDYAERLRREHPDLYRDGGGGRGGGMGGGGRGEGGGGGGEGRDPNRRQAATDEIMLERFRKRERNRMMRR